MVCKDSKWFVSNKYLGFEAKEKEWEAYVGEVRVQVVSDNKSATLKWRLSDKSANETAVQANHDVSIYHLRVLLRSWSCPFQGSKLLVKISFTF